MFLLARRTHPVDGELNWGVKPWSVRPTELIMKIGPVPDALEPGIRPDRQALARPR